MKYFLLLSSIAILSCTKSEQEPQHTTLQDHSFKDGIGGIVATRTHLGVPGKVPNLYIPENEVGWNDYTRVGLRVGYKAMFSGVLRYDCLIANGTPGDTPPAFDYSGTHDFVICKSCDAIVDSAYGGYNFPGILEIRLYKDGERVGTVIKQTFDVENNRSRIGFDHSKERYYGNDTMFVNQGAGDNYFNKVPIPSDGQYVVAVEVNPDRLITESNYDDNLSFMPVTVSAGRTAVVDDPSAMSAGIPKVITDLKAVYDGKGKYKTVTLSWTSGADEFCIQRDNAMIKKELYGSTTYTDTLPPGSRQVTYKILAENEGLGKTFSNPITVSKN